MSSVSDFFGIDIDLAGGGGKTPTPQKAELPEIAQQHLKDIVASAKRSPEEFAKESMANVESGMGMLGGGAPESFAKTGVQPEKIQAFRNVYGAQTGQAMERMKAQTAIEAEQRKMQKLQIASQLMLDQAGLQTKYYQSLTNAYNQMEAQRAALISNISGTAGQAIGMYYGSQPKGIGSGNYTPDATIQRSQNLQPMQPVQTGYLGTIGGE